MFIVYRLVDSKGEMLSDADLIERLKGIIGHLDQGRYTVDEIASHPLPRAIRRVRPLNPAPQPPRRLPSP